MNQLTRPILKQVSATLERLHPMPQNALTIQIGVRQSRELALRQLLETINKDPADNPLLPFSVFENLHFSRLLLLEGADHPEHYDTSLVFLANVDGPIEDFLLELVRQNAEGLDTVLSNCKGYPAKRERNESSRLVYLRNATIPSQAFYINTVGRDARQIRQEDELHDALERFLNEVDASTFDSAQALRHAVIDFVCQNPELAWALAARAQPSLSWRAIEKLRFAGLAALGMLIIAWAWPVLVAWLLILRFRETQDEEDTHRAPLTRLNQLRASEDVAAHNPFAAVGFVKAGWLRRTTSRALLAAAQVILRHVFNKGNLAGVPLLGLDGVDTIHFARWTMLDNDRRLLFTSNYDGSLESYMVDFIDKVAWGLNIIFSNGEGYPRTRWILHDGARKEQMFKDYLGNHMVENQVWFTPYPHLTAVNIANNASIRDGLRGRMNEVEAQAWLRRL